MGRKEQDRAIGKLDILGSYIVKQEVVKIKSKYKANKIKGF